MAKLTTEEFIKRAREVHGDKYDYSKVEYVNNESDVVIICPEHGEFLQKPHYHLGGNGCPECGGTKKLSTSVFVERAKSIHGDRYDYSKVSYVNNKTKVCIVCSEHGEFWQKPNSHLRGVGCPLCAVERRTSKQTYTIETFLKLAIEKHGEKYDYSITDYKNERNKIKIICHKRYKNGIEHGEFLQTPHAHLNGNGCPHCRNSQLESKMSKLLIENKIEFEKEKTYDWLINNGHMYLDFYLPKYNVAIECQGVQHYADIEIQGRKKYEYIHENDLLKNKLCNENGIKIFYFTDKNMYNNYCKNKELTYFDFNSMLNDIKNERKT